MQSFNRFYRKKTETLRRLLKKDSVWNWRKQQDEDFNKLKGMLTEEPCLAHYAKDRENIVTTDASKRTSILARNRNVFMLPKVQMRPKCPPLGFFGTMRLFLKVFEFDQRVLPCYL